jgi:general secretion pathway protein A
MGQPELRERLSTPQMRQLEQRIAVRFHLQGLSRAETQQYVMHRLSVAGAANSITFTARAWALIHQYCTGIPRRINLLCDRILMTAYVRGTHRITARMVRHSLRDLSGPRRPLAAPRPGFSPLFALACGSMLGLGVLGFVTGAFIVPAARERLRPFLPAPLQALTQHLMAAPSLPPPPAAPPPPPLLAAPLPPSPLSIEVNLPLAQRLWQVKTQAEGLLSPTAAIPPTEYQAIVLQTANAMGFDAVAIQAEASQLSLFSRPCLIEVIAEPPAPQPVLWVLARGLEAGVLLYEPTGLTSVPLQQLQEIEYGKIYLLLEKEKYHGPTLRQGMQGARVHALQQVLHALGYFTGSPSGEFDAHTLQAVKDFQRDKQLTVDGYVGRQTLMMLLYLDGRILTETT